MSLNISNDDWYIPAVISLLFIILSAPNTYKHITGPIVENIFDVKIQHKGKPKQNGLILHSILMFVILYFVLQQ